MRKFSLLIALALLITVGSVYATWTYIDKTDVADITEGKAVNLTGATFVGTYGTYTVDVTGLVLQIDPKEENSHITSLIGSGQVVITFTPSIHAPTEIKTNAVASTFQIKLSNDNWTFDDGSGSKNIFVLTHQGTETISWSEPDSNGVFTFTLTAADLLDEHLSMNEFTLDSKSDYERFTTALTNGQITFTVSDGKTSTP